MRNVVAKVLRPGSSPGDLKKLLSDLEERLGPAGAAGAAAAGRELAERERREQEIAALKSAIAHGGDINATGRALEIAGRARAELDARAAAVPRREFLPAFAAGPDARAVARAVALPTPDPARVAELRERLQHGPTDAVREEARRELNALGSAAVAKAVARRELGS